MIISLSLSLPHDDDPLTAAMAAAATSVLPLYSSLLLPVHHPMAKAGEAQAEAEKPRSEGSKAFFPLRKHTRDEENPETCHALSRRGSRAYRSLLLKLCGHSVPLLPPLDQSLWYVDKPVDSFSKEGNLA